MIFGGRGGFLLIKSFFGARVVVHISFFLYINTLLCGCSVSKRHCLDETLRNEEQEIDAIFMVYQQTPSLSPCY